MSGLFRTAYNWLQIYANISIKANQITANSKNARILHNPRIFTEYIFRSYLFKLALSHKTLANP